MLFCAMGEKTRAEERFLEYDALLRLPVTLEELEELDSQGDGVDTAGGRAGETGFEERTIGLMGAKGTLICKEFKGKIS